MFANRRKVGAALSTCSEEKKGSWIHCWDLLTSCGEAVVAVMGLVDACRLLVRVIKSD